MTRDSRPLPPPSWPKVIATTLRLWLVRHVLPARLTTGRAKPAGPKPGPAARWRSHRRLTIAALVIVVAAGAMTAEALLLTGHGSANAEARGPMPLTSASSLRPGSASSAPASQPSSAELAAAASRDQAAAWIAAQVTHGVIVACDPLMCAALQQHGFPAADLAPISASSRDPLGAALVVSTLAVRSQLGPLLATVYAPVVIAGFGENSSLVQVRESADGSTASYLAAMGRDLRARKAAGIQLSRNTNIQAPAAARAELKAGRVDSRLLITLAALAHRFPVKIRSFGDGGPGTAGSSPLRQVTVTAPSAQYLSRLLAFLRAQRPPLLAAVAQHHDGGLTLIQFRFTAPSPLGLLSTRTSQ